MTNGAGRSNLLVMSRVCSLIILTAAILSLNSCTDNPSDKKLSAITGRTMGTFYNIKIVNEEPGMDLTLLEKGINELLDEVNRQMSTYRKDSEITGFNNSGSTEWYTVSKDFTYVVEKSLDISKMTDGAFDITVGPIVNVWGFGPEIKESAIPDKGAIEKAKSRTGYHLISVRNEPPAIRKDIPDVYIDLSAIAKGFGVDKVSEYLDSNDIRNYLVEIGGEVRVKGMNHEQQPWQIGIEKPDETGSLENIISLTDFSLATSGDYHNYFEVEGKRYSHTIDPRTAMPITHTLASVSVLHESCTIADGLATAINVLGPDAGFEFAFNQKLSVHMIVRDGGKFVEKSTPSFSKYLRNK